MRAPAWVRPLRRWLRSTRRRIGVELVASADAARDEGRLRDAGILYEQALRLVPHRSDVAIQAGHMFKESRDFPAAERHYLAALSLRPEDADLALQLGHFYKTIDRLRDALVQYRRACSLAPDWAEPRREVAATEQRLRGGVPAVISDVAGEERARAPVPELLPGPITPPGIAPLDEIVLRRLGGPRVGTSDGPHASLAGVEAIRGLCFCDAEIVRADVLIDGSLLHSEPIRSVRVEELAVSMGYGSGIARNAEPPIGPDIYKAVFNLWIDFGTVEPGHHLLELVLTDALDRTRRRIEAVVVEPAPTEAQFPGSDAVVEVDRAAFVDLVTQIRSRASEIRPSSRNMLGEVRKILVLRTDQLGDMVASIPALARLRSLFPSAWIVGLATSANVELGRTLGYVDEWIDIDFPDDVLRRQRTMTLAVQEELRERLGSYHFDLALDLATSHMSRALLKLSGARVTYGFDDSSWPWMTAGLAGGTHDPRNGIEIAPQSGRVLALIERLATLKDSGARIVRRSDLDHRLVQLCLAGERYMVVHTGARITFSRWPGYRDLIAALLARAYERIVLLTDDPELVTSVMKSAGADPRLTIIDRRLAFEDLDALLSGCAVFVGNDSGPKHLAALRGVPVVSLHSARINWSEWGQEQTGLIISRRVPCAGCAIYHDIDECAKDYACVSDIRVEEVLDAVLSLLDEPGSR